MLRDVEAVLFDWDGVLVDNEPIVRAAYQRVAAPLGVSVDERFYAAALHGHATSEGLARICAHADLDADEGFLGSLAEQLRVCFDELDAELLRLAPGEAELLRRLAARLRVGIVSQSPAAKIERTGALGMVETIVGVGDAPAPKPAPDPYLVGLALVGVPASRALAVEDSAVGVASARAAGLRVAGVAAARELADVPLASLGVLAARLGC
jgi:HAD superfamily hydrolase (TIGR01509 family)